MAAVVTGFVSSVLTLAFLGGLGVQLGFQLIGVSNNAAEEIRTLVDEVQHTRHALNPIENHIRSGNVDPADQQLVLSAIDRLRDMEKSLFDQLMDHLGGRKLNVRTKWGWAFRRNRLRELAVNISTQKTTLMALQLSILAKQTRELSRQVSLLSGTTGSQAQSGRAEVMPPAASFGSNQHLIEDHLPQCEAVG